MNRSGFSKILAFLMSMQLMLLMFPSTALAEIGDAAQAPLTTGTSEDLTAQADGEATQSYIVTVEPTGDDQCSYSDMQVRVYGENGEVLYESPAASPDPDSKWAPKDFAFGTSEQPKSIEIKLMWKNAEFNYTQLSFSEAFPHDYDDHQIAAEGDSKQAAVGTYYVERTDSAGALCYVDQDGMPQQRQAGEWENLVEHEEQFTGGWFAVRDVRDLNHISFVAGDNNLVLCDGAELRCPSGVLVVEDASLTIWSQREGTGKLVAQGQKNNAKWDFNPYNPNVGYGDAGIGGYGTDYGTACGDITINGGIIEAKGGPGAAGIGGSERSGSGAITINRGQVIAFAGEDKGVDHDSGFGAGIGGGAKGDSGPITINGGVVYAEGAAGIGGGDEGDSGPITITGGNVHAIGVNSRGSAIGGGYDGGNKGAITISGGVVKAELIPSESSTTTLCPAAAIGAGSGHAQDGAITISNGASVTAISRGFGAGIGGGHGSRKGKSGGTITISGASTRVVAVSLHGAGIGSGGDDLGVNAGNGNHNGGNITINDGIVYAQSFGSGAGIGGGNNGKGGNITINGGLVRAYGGTTEYTFTKGSNASVDTQSMSAQGSAGDPGVALFAASGLTAQDIPSMDSVADPVLKYMDSYMYGLIADAILDAIFSGEYSGAGIGGGDDGSGGTVTINGGIVEARSGKNEHFQYMGKDVNICSAIGWGDGGSKSIDLSVYDSCKVTYGDLYTKGDKTGQMDPASLKTGTGSAAAQEKASSYAYVLIEPSECTATFNMGGHGTAPESQEIPAGGKVQHPGTPTENGWVFDGWYTDATYAEPFDFDKPIYAGTTVYAKWLETYPLKIRKTWPDGATLPEYIEMYYVNTWDTWDTWNNGTKAEGQMFLKASENWEKTIYVTEESYLDLREFSSVAGFAPDSWSISRSTAGTEAVTGSITENDYTTINLGRESVKALITRGDAVLTWANTNMKAFKVKMEWDIDQFKHYKPESVNVVLQSYENGQWGEVDTLSLNDENNWQGTFDPVPLDGEYRIRELDADGNPVLDQADDGGPNAPAVTLSAGSQQVTYQVAYDIDAGGNTTITNSIAERIHAKVAWNGNDEGAPKPDSVQLVLQHCSGAGDTWGNVQTLTLSAATGWEGDFLPELSPGNYRVRELNANGGIVYKAGDEDTGQNATFDKAVFAVNHDGSARKYEYAATYADDISVSSEHPGPAVAQVTVANNVSGTIYSVTKSWVGNSRYAQDVSAVYAVLQHKQKDGTWNTIAQSPEAGTQNIALLMNRVGALGVERDYLWTADFDAVAYGEPDENYRVREVISDYRDYYQSGCSLGEGEEDATYTVNDRAYRVKTLLAKNDRDNAEGAMPRFTYSFKGDWVATFDVSYGRDGGNFTITNTEEADAPMPVPVPDDPTPSQDDVEETLGGSVRWTGDAESDRPESVNLHVYAERDGKKWEVAGSPIAATKESAWEWSLPLLVGDPAIGAKISVTEDEVPNGYEARCEGLDVMNVYVGGSASERVTVSGRVSWNDENNRDGIRPDSVTLNLLENGEVIDSLQVSAANGAEYTSSTGNVISAENNWVWAFADLPKYDSNNALISYAIEEVQTGVITGTNGPGTYKSQATLIENAESNNWVVSNTHDHEVITVSGEVVWSGTDQAAEPPSEVEIYVNSDIGLGKRETVQADDNGAWPFEFTGLPKYYEGRQIKYYVSEAAVPGYRSDVTGTMRNGFTVTNVYEPDKAQVRVALIWNDAYDNDGIRPSSSTVQLYGNGADTGKRAILSAANSWSYTFAGLDETQGGEKIEYSIRQVEDAVVTGEDGPGTYTADIFEGSYDYDAESNRYRGQSAQEGTGNEFTVVNTHTPETVAIAGAKTWDDYDNRDGKRPESIRVRLKADGRDCALETVSAANEWKWDFGSFPKYRNGRAISYTVIEDAVPNYIAQYDGFNVTNHYYPDMTQVTVSKVWDDGDNRDAIRPNMVLVDVLADGRVVQTLALYENNGWMDSTDALPVQQDGRDIAYSVREQKTAVVSGSDAARSYAIETAGDAQRGFTITNTHTPTKASVAVSKVWDDQDALDGLRPASVVARLYEGEGDAAVDTGRSIELSADTGWEGAFNGLDPAVTYSVREDATDIITGEDGEGTYASAVGGSMENGFVMVNGHTPEMVSATGRVAWDHAGNENGAHPESVTVRLLADNEPVADAVAVVSAECDWSFSFTDLPKYRDSVPINYTVSVDAIEDYATTVGGTMAEGFTVTNAYLPGKTQVNVAKVWNDANDADGIRPESVTVKLLADGQDTGKALELSADGAWAGSFADLDAKKDGAQIAYTVEEQLTEVVTGEDGADTYACAVSGDATAGFTVTNTHTPAAAKEQGVITYKLNGGTYNGSSEDIVEAYEVGETIAVHEAPVRDGYTFLYWKGSKYQPGDSYTVTGDHVFVAQWEEQASSPGSTGDSQTKGSSSSATTRTGDVLGMLGLACALTAIAAYGAVLVAARRRK